MRRRFRQIRQLRFPTRSPSGEANGLFSRLRRRFQPSTRSTARQPEEECPGDVPSLAYIAKVVLLLHMVIFIAAFAAASLFFNRDEKNVFVTLTLVAAGTVGSLIVALMLGGVLILVCAYSSSHLKFPKFRRKKDNVFKNALKQSTATKRAGKSQAQARKPGQVEGTDPTQLIDLDPTEPIAFTSTQGISSAPSTSQTPPQELAFANDRPSTAEMKNKPLEDLIHKTPQKQIQPTLTSDTNQQSKGDSTQTQNYECSSRSQEKLPKHGKSPDKFKAMKIFVKGLTESGTKFDTSEKSFALPKRLNLKKSPSRVRNIQSSPKIPRKHLVRLASPERINLSGKLSYSPRKEGRSSPFRSSSPRKEGHSSPFVSSQKRSSLPRKEGHSSPFRSSSPRKKGHSSPFVSPQKRSPRKTPPVTPPLQCSPSPQKQTVRQTPPETTPRPYSPIPWTRGVHEKKAFRKKRVSAEGCLSAVEEEQTPLTVSPSEDAPPIVVTDPEGEVVMFIQPSVLVTSTMSTDSQASTFDSEGITHIDV